MTDSERDLVAVEGVDQGSAAVPGEGDAGPEPEADAVLGRPGVGVPASGEQDAAPVEVGEPTTGIGQRQQVGEG